MDKTDIPASFILKTGCYVISIIRKPANDNN